MLISLTGVLTDGGAEVFQYLFLISFGLQVQLLILFYSSIFSSLFYFDDVVL